MKKIQTYFWLLVCVCVTTYFFNTSPPITATDDLATKINTLCKLEGKVIKVSDGDTIHVLDADKTTHKIRLASIDAPEIGQGTI